MTADEPALRAFLARILGYGRAAEVEHALASVRLAVSHCAALVLLGGFDLVPIALAIHRRAVGADRPFVVSDPERGHQPAPLTRDPANLRQGVAAFRAALGGTVCLHEHRPPADLPALAALVRAPDASVTVIVCAAASFRAHPFLVRPAPVHVPHLSARPGEVPQIVDECGREATDELGAAFTRVDREWVLENAASSLAEIDKATRRIVALRATGSLNKAAALLGITHTALSRWFRARGAGGRGRPPP